MNRRIGNRFTVELAMPDGLVLMDCMMPGLDGYDTTAGICRLRMGAARTPVRAMPANAKERDREPIRVLSRWVPTARAG